MDHSNIIKELGGIRKVAAMLGHNLHTTVQGWADRNSIPVDRWAEIIQAAGDHGKLVDGKPLTFEVLVPTEAKEAAETKGEEV